LSTNVKPPAPEMAFRTRGADCLAGEVDLSTISRIRAVIGRLLADAAVGRIVVELDRVTFLDSSGIGTLVGCKRQAIDAGKRMQVNGAAGRVADVFDLVGVTEFLTG
jgi:anti-sigma B factor antagonist